MGKGCFILGRGQEPGLSGSLKPGSLDFYLWPLDATKLISTFLVYVTTFCEGHYILSTSSELSRNRQKLIMSFVLW